MTLKAWLALGAVSWSLALVALVTLLAMPANFDPEPVLEPERIQVLTCTTQVAIVDAEGETHIKTINCKEEKK